MFLVIKFLVVFQAMAFNLKQIENHDLINLSKQKKSLHQINNWTIIETFNNQCPFTDIEYKTKYIPRLQKTALNFGINWIVLNTSSKNIGDDTHWKLINFSKINFQNFYIVETQALKFAKSLNAKVTPEFFVFSPHGELIFRGPASNRDYFSKDQYKKPSQEYLLKIIETLKSGKSPQFSNLKAVGCHIEFR